MVLKVLIIRAGGGKMVKDKYHNNSKNRYTHSVVYVNIGVNWMIS